MNSFILFSNAIGGGFLISAALLLVTKGLADRMIFKVVPFFIGLALIINVLYLSGIFNKQ